MKLFVVAPIRVDFSLEKSETVFKSSRFFQYWNEVKNKYQRVEGIEKINFYQLNNNSIYDDSAYDSLNKTERKIFGLIFTNKANEVLKNIENKEVKNFIDLYIKSIETFEIQFYDNTIAIVDMRVILKDIEKEKSKEFTKNSEITIKQIIKEVIKKSKEFINNFIKILEKEDSKNIIQKKEDYNDFIDIGKEDVSFKLLWASNALIYEKEDKNKEYILDYWLNDIIEKNKIEEIKNDTKSYSLKWIKYVFREENEDIEEFWNTMFLSQYYYCVIEIIIYNLRLIINESSKKEQSKFSIKKFFQKDDIITTIKKFESISNTANLHIIEYNDTMKYLSRKNLALFNNILETWTFTNILDNSKNLLSIVKENIDRIYSKISSKNNFYTDILLTAIGFFAIINLVISLNQYSRSYTADAMISSRGNEQDDILYFISTIPTDLFLLSGFSVSVVLLVGYFIYRKKILP